MIDEILDDAKVRMEKAVEHVPRLLGGIQTIDAE
jgi:hypothetical protein